MGRLRGSPTSALSAFCDSFYPQHHDFHFFDGDEVLLRYSAQPIVYARETRVLRIVESKMPDEEVRRSQRDSLPLLAACLELGVAQGVLAAGSGVYVVTGEPPFDNGATVAKVRAGARAAGIQFEREPRMVDRDTLIRFMRCR